MNDYAIVVDRVCKTYRNKATPAVDELSFSVKKGSFFGLLGPNGAGKSTTLQILSHLVRPDTGIIQIEGWDYEKNSFEARRTIGVVPQEFNFNIFETPTEILYNHAGYYGLTRSVVRERVQYLLSVCDLSAQAHVPSRTLSGGMKRRLMIARALVHSPSILILDEPTVGVDPQVRQVVWDFLRSLNQQGTTIILTSHYFEEVESLCDEIAMMQKGKLLLQLPIRDFLQKLPRQKLQIEVDHPINTEMLTILLKHFPSLESIAPEILVFTQNQGESLGPLIASLEKEGYKVLNIAPQKARLEQLFMNMLNRQEAI